VKEKTPFLTRGKKVVTKTLPSSMQEEEEGRSLPQKGKRRKSSTTTYKKRKFGTGAAARE